MLTIIASTLIAAALLGVARVLAVVRLGPVGGRTLAPRLPPGALSLPVARAGEPGGAAAIALRPWPAALAVAVDADGGEVLAGVGRLAARSLFPPARYPPFEVRVLHLSPRPTRWARRSAWADGASPLCGVHLSLFEVEVQPARWRCPFGYRDAATVDAETLLRLVKADWGYFTAYLWGVPLDAAAACDEVPPLEALRVVRATSRAALDPGAGVAERGASSSGSAAGPARVDAVELAPIQVPGPARARADRRDRLPPDRLVGAAWRFLLGDAPAGDGARSFAPIALRVRAELWHRIVEGEGEERGRRYRTTVLCAAAHDDHAAAEETLAAGLAALRSTAARLALGR